MAFLTLEQAETICDTAMAEWKKRGWNPLTVAVFDGRGALRVFKQPDPSTLSRGDMAMGKGFGAFVWGQPTRTLGERVKNGFPGHEPINLRNQGRIVPLTGGVVIRDTDGTMIGSVGVSGDRSERDEACAIIGIKAAGLVPDPLEPEHAKL
jgi:uncharacterized protein GlcG (DUF336 family)